MLYLRGSGATLMSGQERPKSDKRDVVGRQEGRPNADDLRAVRTGVGAALQALYSDVLSEEVPEGIAELLRQLDQQRDVGA
jgi:hypothetical protein